MVGDGAMLCTELAARSDMAPTTGAHRRLPVSCTAPVVKGRSRDASRRAAPSPPPSPTLSRASTAAAGLTAAAAAAVAGRLSASPALLAPLLLLLLLLLLLPVIAAALAEARVVEGRERGLLHSALADERPASACAGELTR